MPGQRKKGKKLIGYYEWETNIELLQKEATRRGVSVSDLMKELTENLINMTGGKAKKHNDDSFNDEIEDL